MAEDEMVGWYYQLNGHESEQAPGNSEGQGSLACCSPWRSEERRVGKVMSLLFNMLSMFVITFLTRSKHLLISWLQLPSTVILEPLKISLSLFPLSSLLFAMK